MLSSIIVQALKLVTIVENWLPIPAPPFGESALSSLLMQLEYCTIGSSVSQILHGCKEYLEKQAGSPCELAAMVSQYHSDVTEFLDFIESNRPLEAHENELRDNSLEMALSVQDSYCLAKTCDQSPARIKSERGAKEKNSKADGLGTSDGTELLML